MKNRKLVLILSMVLAMTMSLGGTLTYLSDTDADVNTMVLGNVDIAQNEQQRVEIGNAAAGLEDFEDDQVMLPAVYDVSGHQDPARETVVVNGYEITVGGGMRTFPNYMDKIVSVTNTGKSNAYVRTIIAVPAGINEDDSDGDVSEQWLHVNVVSDSDTSPANGWYYGRSESVGEYPANLADHYVVKNVDLFENGKLYDIIVATNKNSLPKDATTGPNLVGLYLDNDVNYKNDAYYAKDMRAEGTKQGATMKVWEGTDLKVYVLSQAVQTAGFDDAWTALSGAFGDVTADKAKEWFKGFAGESESPEVNTPTNMVIKVQPVNGLVPYAVQFNDPANGVSATVPAGAKMADGATSLKLVVEAKKKSEADVNLTRQDELFAYNVKVEGLAADNTVPVIINMGEVLPVGLNLGNYDLYHVENGKTVSMTRVAGAPVNHNEFTYNPATGEVTVAMATFSEVAMVSDTENAWKGKYDYTWYSADATTLTIANADQLAAFGKIVGGMAKDADENAIDRDSFSGKTIKLLADVDLGDNEEANVADKIFYPIGYYYNGDSSSPSSTVNSFEGTFDGNGHKISNFYQNTWEIKGDYDGNYYNDAMGLFGYVYNGTIKNLTVDNFSSDGEFTPTGVIAAYADGNSKFENIAITNCNPRVYNTGNGGIIGIAGDTNTANDDHLTLTNITVDNSNKISALWGSWDVACGGLVGMYRGNVDGNGAATGDTITFTNCHVAAQIDVYNDVCANYQYYAYRYAGMIIGSVRHNTTENGHDYPDLTGVTAENCTVNYGDWNTYYYCELVANSPASYTHDYQFSRLEQVKNIEDKTITYLDGTTGTIPTSGTYNYVVVNGDHCTDNADCYHYVNGEQWKHEDAGTETVNGVSDVDVEDKQHLFLPFAQLFTGYGWGVTSKGVTDFEGFETMGIGITEGKQEESVVKFNSVFPNATVDKETGVVATDFLYRVGNQNTVNVGSLFEVLPDYAKDSGHQLEVKNNVHVTVDPLNDDMNVSGTFTANTSDWTKGTIKFTGTGVVKVTIQDYQYCTPTVLYLEVVDATNVTEYSELKNQNSVLLNDITMSSGSSYYLSGATLYGNGFTFDMTDGTYAAGGNTSSNYVFGLNNANLDNVKIVGAVYTTYGATVQSEYNRAAVLSTGNNTITNCYISNCASAVRVRDGNLEIVNSTIKGGNFANIDIRGGHVILDNVTTINQVKGNDTATDGTVVVGLGIVVYYEKVLNTTTVEIKNGITQYNYLSKAQANAYITDTTAKNLVSKIYDSDYSAVQYNDGSDTWVNTGILSMTAEVGNDNITDVDGYVDASPTMTGVTGYLHTKKPDATSIAESAPDYATAGQGAIAPSYSFDYTTKNYVAKTDGSNDYCYEDGGTVYMSMDEGYTFNWDTSILTATKNGQTLSYTVTMNGTDYTGKSIAFNTAGNYTVTYTYTDSNNYKLDEDSNIITYSKTYTKTVHISVAVIEASAKHAEFTMGSSNAATEQITVDNVTYISATGVTADNSTWTYMTVGDQKIYYPIIAAKLTSTTGSSSYAYFPVFENAVTITDYADGGTGAAVTHNSSTTTLPSGLTAVKGIYKAAADVTSWTNLNNSHLTQSGASKIFKWASSSDAPSDPTTYNNVLCYKSPQVSANRVAYITLVQYSYTDATNTTYYYYVGYTLEVFTKSGIDICVTPDTLVTLADGSKKEIQHVKVGDEVLAWNFYTGAYEIMPVSLLQAHHTGMQDVLHLTFDDGTVLKVLGEHGIFDVEKKSFIFIDKDDVTEYVGRTFLKQDGSGFKQVKLVDYKVVNEYTTAYTILSADHYNVLLEDMLTVTPAHVGDNFFNPFEIGEDMKYDDAKVQADIEKYGLYTYEDFAHVLTETQFEALNMGHFKVSVGKGLITYDGLIYLIENFINGDF